jgi:TonB family protein
MLFRVVIILGLLVTLCGAQVQVPLPSAPPELLKDLRSKDPGTRRTAANQLGAMRARNAVRGLAELLTDRDQSVREATAFALGQITDRGVSGLLIPLLADKDVEVRSTAAFALGMLGDRKAIDALSYALGDPEPEVQSSALVALGLMQDDEGVDEITESLEDPSFDVRYDAVWALGQIGEPDSEEHLRGALVTIDLLKISGAAREAFRECVQNAIADLRTEAHRIAGEQAARPRRVTGVVTENRYGNQSRPLRVKEECRAMPTARATAAHVTGAVRLKVLVSANGRAARAYVIRRLGYGLDQRAVQAVMQYKFDPAVESGLPQSTWMELEIRF